MPFLTTALIALAVAGTVTGTVGAIKANEAAKSEEDARGRLEKIRAKRERTQQIRQARIRRAEILQQGESAGASESSAVQSGASGVYGQAFSNIQYINQQESTGTAIRNARQAGLDAQGTQILGKGMKDIAMVGLSAQQAGIFDKDVPLDERNVFDSRGSKDWGKF